MTSKPATLVLAALAVVACGSNSPMQHQGRRGPELSKRATQSGKGGAGGTSGRGGSGGSAQDYPYGYAFSHSQF